MKLDRLTARALVDAGYMPLRDYIEQFDDEDRFESFSARPASQVLDIGNHRTRQWGEQTSFARRRGRHGASAAMKNSAA